MKQALSPMLYLMYNESLAQGTVPDDWRQENVSSCGWHPGYIFLETSSSILIGTMGLAVSARKMELEVSRKMELGVPT